MRVRLDSGHGRGGAALVVAALLVAWPVATSSASASSGPLRGNDRAAAVQAVLDRVLGPGNATVVVSDTIRTSSAQTTSLRWGSGVPAATSSSTVVVPGGSSTVSSQRDAVGGTATTVVSPPGALVTQSVAVAVDAAHVGRVRIRSLRPIVAAAAGIVRARGDRLSIVALRFARPAPVTPVAPTIASVLLPYATPGVWALGSVVALIALAMAFRRPRRAKAAAGA